MAELKTRRIVVVDDDPDDTDLIQTAVEEIDSSVDCTVFHSAENAITFFKKISDQLPDFIILDLNMPKVSGRECLLKIRELPMFDQVPVIINSTTIFPKDKTELKTMGASFIFTKTSRFDKLIEILKFIMKKNWAEMH